MDDDLMELLVERRYVVGAPRSEKDLRVLYPEMFDFPEFSRSSLRHKDDVLFVWWWACACSPYYDLSDQERLPLCIGRAYRTPERREQKMREYEGCRFPDEIKAAIKRMQSINVSARIENHVCLLRIRENCRRLLGADITRMSQEERDEWTKRAPALWGLMEDTLRAMERGSFGVTDAELSDTGNDGALRDFRAGM